jgi:EmrB/QacA subfamily drug resistance transporter
MKNFGGNREALLRRSRGCGVTSGSGEDERRWPALALLCVAQFVVVLDVTIVAIALPEIQASLGFSPADLQWVVSAYTLVFGGFLLLAGRAADLYGRRRLFMAGLALFSGASLVCGLAATPLALVASRVAQGLGAAIVSPSALSALTTTFPEGAGRARALGVWTAAAAGGGAAGWVLGGVLAEGLGWEWVFFVNVPVGVLGLALAPVLLEESRDESAPPRLDAAGAVTATAGLTLLVYGLTRAEAAGLGSAVTLGALSLALAFLGAFVLVEKRVRDPLVALDALRSRRLVGANLVALALTAATTPPMFLCTLYVQRVLGYSPAEAGLAFPPLNLSVVVGSLIGPRLTDRIGGRAAMVSGLLAIAAGVLLLARIPPGGGHLGHLLPSFVLMGAGLGCASVASTASGTSAADDEKQGLVSGLLNAAAQVGTALGLAVLIPLSAARTDALAGVPLERALVEGFRWGFFGAAGIAVLGALLALFLVRRVPRSGVRRR